MKTSAWLAGLMTSAVLVIGGCADSTTPKTTSDSKKPATHGETGEGKTGLAKLSDEDRKIAEAQKYCVIEQDSLLGSMGAPVKLTVKDQTVFVCCKSCTKEATADPDKTLTALATVKKKAQENAPKQ